MASKKITDLTQITTLPSDALVQVDCTPVSTLGSYSFNLYDALSSATIADGDKGDITVSSSGATWTIDAGAVTLSKMANMATASLLGRNTAGTGSPEVLSASTAKTLLSLNNVENTALSTWTGSTSITTLGTIATGTWNATAIGVAKGGTGLTATPSNGQIPIGNGSGYSLATLTAGSNVTITNASGSITIAASGGGGGTPAGSDTQVQYNSAGAFGATSSFTVDTGGTNTPLVRINSSATGKPVIALKDRVGQTADLFQCRSYIDDSVTFAINSAGNGVRVGNWLGSAIQPTYGGTGLTTLGTALQVLRTNSGASAIEWASQLNGSAGDLPIGSSQTASFTATVGTIFPINLSSVTNHLTVTFPSTPSTGDVFGYYISNTNASWEATLNRNGNTIRGGTSVDEYRIWQVGEYLVWRYLSGTWQLVGDGRIASNCLMTKASSQTLTLTDTFYRWACDTATIDPAGMANTGSNQVTIRRKGLYFCNASQALNNTGTAAYFFQSLLLVNGNFGTGTGFATDRDEASGGASSTYGYSTVTPNGFCSVNRGDFICVNIYTAPTNGRTTLESRTAFLSVQEVLQ